MAKPRQRRIGCVIPCAILTPVVAWLMYPWYGDEWLFILGILFVLFVAGLQWCLDRYWSRPPSEENSS
jgi:hypothetical protein